MTLYIVVQGAGENWTAEPWRERFAARLTSMPIALWPTDTPAPEAVRYVAVWKPPPGLLGTFPNLEVIFNLGAGVDALVADATLPDVPLVRVATSDLTKRMTEYVVMHVLMHHRQQRRLDAGQRQKRWDTPDQRAASAVRVGIMGLGELGRDSAEVLARLGFQVAGWSRSPRNVPGIECYAGADQLDAFLARTDILVVLVPLTPDTRGILSASLFKKLARDGVLGGPIVINAGRGGLQVEDDIVAALNDETLQAVTLDVFNTEPLPADHPLWSHPKATITPHNAADSDPDAISDYVVAQIKAYERGEPLQNVVDRARGY
jgi:glyoxylate/hydroxypyruvate reductase A